jgi:lysophospholipase
MSEAKVLEGQEVRTETGRLPGPGGTELFWREWAPVGGPQTGVVLVFVHGAGEHSGRYDDFGRFFASRGYPVLALDLPGLGRSGGPRGHIDRFADYIESVLAAREQALTKHPDRRPVIVGHSMGGLIALSVVEEHPRAFGAAVVSSPCLALAVKVPGWKTALAKVIGRLIPRLTMGNEIDPATLARNPEVGRRYAADPDVCRVASAGWYLELVGAMDRTRARAGLIEVPVLILQGTEDRLVDPEAVRAFADSLGDIGKEFRAYAGLYHELFQEDQRWDIFAAVLAWLEASGLK